MSLRKMFHTTPFAETIIRDGFRDVVGHYGFDREVAGVFLSDAPLAPWEVGGVGQVLSVDFPADFDLDQFAIVTEGQPTWEWLVPAAVINQFALVAIQPPTEEAE